MTLILACDGGATFTRAGLYTADRVLIAETTGGPSNPTEYGIDHCVNTLAAVAASLTSEPVAVIAAGIAGAMRRAARETIARRLCAKLGAARVLITDDLHSLLFANAGRSPAVLAIAGTGSSVMAQNAGGQWVLVGGRGRVFGDDGSAHQIAVTALRACAHALDGLGRETCLVEELPAGLGLRAFADMAPWAAAATKEEVAALATTVDAAAGRGDAVACRCIADQAERLAAQTAAAAGQLSLPPDVSVYVHGGVFEHSPRFHAAYDAALRARNANATARSPIVKGHRAVVELALAGGPLPDWVSVCTRDQAASETAPHTEQWDPEQPPLDALSPGAIVKRMNAEDARISRAVACQTPVIAATIEAVVRAFARGGRLIYIGAGTSGRLGVLDASECPATFGVPSDKVLAVIAGGDRALREGVEAAEDDTTQAVSDLDDVAPPMANRDVVVGISASGRTPYTLAALDYAGAKGAATVLLCCKPAPDVRASIVIALDTGPEILPGSTRLKAGTATKLVLNMISTGAMALSGYVYDGLMVGVCPINTKLRRRALGIISALTGTPHAAAERLLDEAHGSVPVAVLMARRHVSLETASRTLEDAGGILREALAKP
jgi:N-acetylmuramic acid 6-phosphate etherase